MNSITFVCSLFRMHLNVFLVVMDKTAYLISWLPETKEFGYMCPCCMNLEQQQAIASAVRLGLNSGEFEGKVKWCSSSPSSCAPNGTVVPDLLVPDLYCEGDANVDLAHMKDEIHAEAERQIAAGRIRLRN